MEFVERYRGWAISVGYYPRRRHTAEKEGQKLFSYKGIEGMRLRITQLENRGNKRQLVKAEGASR